MKLINNFIFRVMPDKLIHRYLISTILMISAVSFFLIGSMDSAFSGEVSASAHGSPKTPRILVLCSYGYSLPAYSRLNPALIRELENNGITPDDIFIEFLDLAHMQDKKERLFLAELLEYKYASLGVDLIICLHRPAVYFMIEEAAGRFPDVPVIAWSARAAFDRLAEYSGFLPMAGRMDIDGSIRNALALFPRTRQVLFVIGDSPMDRDILEEARESFKDWEPVLVIKDTHTESMEEVLEHIARLPSNSIVIFGNFFQDVTGRTFTPRDAGRRVVEAASVPVFALYDTMLGEGVVGGDMLSFASEGTRLGQRAVDIIRGIIIPSRQNSVLVGTAVPMFDWEQMERWDIDVSLLPEDSVVINYHPTLWGRHRWFILIIAALLTAQFILITALLIQRRRRTRAEEELKSALEKAEQGDRLLSVLMENIPEGITIGDADLNLIRVSRYGKDLLGGSHQGKSVEEVISQWKVYRPDGITPMPGNDLPLVRAVRYGETIRDMEVVETDISGKKISLLCNAAPIRDAEGEITGGVVSWRDITEIKQAENAQIRTSQQRQLALDASKMGWWHYNPVTDILYWDDRYREIFGLEGYSGPKDEILKQLHPDDLPGVRAKGEAALNPEDRQPYIGEYRINLPDGSVKWVEAHGIPTFEDMDGTMRATSFVGTVADITERKMEEKALKEKMQEYSIIFERSIVGKAEADLETGRFIKVNRAFCDMTGFAPDELYEMTFSDLAHPEDLSLYFQELESVMAGNKEGWRIESRYMRKDGTVIWVDVAGNRVRFEDEQPDRVIAVIQNITERVHTERSLRENEERFRSLFENSLDAIFLTTPAGRIMNANKAACDMFGYTSEEIIGMGRSVLHIADPDELARAFEQRARDGYIRREMTYLHRDGSKIVTDMSSVIYKGKDGEDLSFVILRDITGNKLAEETLKSSLAEKEVLLKEIHHRVKNNMQVISSLISLQAVQFDDSDVMEILKDVSHRVRSMAMIHETLYQSKDLSQIDFAQYTESLLSYLFRSHGPGASTITLKKELEQIFLPVDRAVPLGLILNELVSNALKHAYSGEEKGEVAVSLTKNKEKGIVLTVRDYGRGLPPGLDWENTDSLGLRLIQMLSSQIHAEVEVKSRGGSEFRVILGESS